jgi:hypothetical protein
MTLPSAAPVSTFTDSDAPQADLAARTEDGRLRTEEGFSPPSSDLSLPSSEEWIAACNLDEFLPRNLPFADWLAEQARQHQIREPGYQYGAWHTWLGDRIDELAKQAFFLGARDPEEFRDRDEAMLRPSGRRGYRRPWIGASVGAIGGIADWLQESHPETAATLRRHLCVLERAAGGAQ